MKGYDLQPLTIGKDFKAKSYSIVEWNPILLAVAKEHKEILEILFEHDATAESFH